VLQLADVLTATPADVPEETYARIVRLLGEDGTVELASAIAWENYRARFNRTFDVGHEGFCSILDGSVPHPRGDSTDASTSTSEQQ
jgi:hypothetical protein